MVYSVSVDNRANQLNPNNQEYKEDSDEEEEEEYLIIFSFSFLPL